MLFSHPPAHDALSSSRMQYKIRSCPSQAKKRSALREQPPLPPLQEITLVFFIAILYKMLDMANQGKKRPSKKGKVSSFDRWIIAGIIITFVLITVTLWGPLRKFRPPGVNKQPQQAVQQEPAPAVKPARKKPAALQQKKEPQKHAPVSALLGGTVP